MKTAEEHWRDLDRCVTSTQEVVLIGLRDAEHRAELDATQRTIEQLGKDGAAMAAENERLKGELAEAERLIAEAAEATCPQRFSEPGRPAKFSDCGSCWTCRAQRFLAAPPPAESTLVQPTQPDDIRERPAVVYATQAQLDQRMRMVSERLDALEAKGEPGTHAKGEGR